MGIGRVRTEYMQSLYIYIYIMIKDKKIGKSRRFFGEISFFGGAGKDFRVEKSFAKKSEKNRNKSPIFRRKIGKIRYFPEKFRFFPKCGVNYILGH